MLSNKERCDIDTIVIVPSEHAKITDEEESEVGWDTFVLSKDVSGDCWKLSRKIWEYES